MLRTHRYNTILSLTSQKTRSFMNTAVRTSDTARRVYLLKDKNNIIQPLLESSQCQI